MASAKVKNSTVTGTLAGSAPKVYRPARVVSNPDSVVGSLTGFTGDSSQCLVLGAGTGADGESVVMVYSQTTGDFSVMVDGTLSETVDMVTHTETKPSALADLMGGGSNAGEDADYAYSPNSAVCVDGFMVVSCNVYKFGGGVRTTLADWDIISVAWLTKHIGSGDWVVSFRGEDGVLSTTGLVSPFSRAPVVVNSGSEYLFAGPRYDSTTNAADKEVEWYIGKATKSGSTFTWNGTLRLEQDIDDSAHGSGTTNRMHAHGVFPFIDSNGNLRVFQVRGDNAANASVFEWWRLTADGATDVLDDTTAVGGTSIGLYTYTTNASTSNWGGPTAVCGTLSLLATELHYSSVQPTYMIPFVSEGVMVLGADEMGTGIASCAIESTPGTALTFTALARDSITPDLSGVGWLSLLADVDNAVAPTRAAMLIGPGASHPAGSTASQTIYVYQNGEAREGYRLLGTPTVLGLGMAPNGVVYYGTSTGVVAITPATRRGTYTPLVQGCAVTNKLSAAAGNTTVTAIAGRTVVTSITPGGANPDLPPGCASTALMFRCVGDATALLAGGAGVPFINLDTVLPTDLTGGAGMNFAYRIWYYGAGEEAIEVRAKPLGLEPAEAIMFDAPNFYDTNGYIRIEPGHWREVLIYCTTDPTAGAALTACDLRLRIESKSVTKNLYHDLYIVMEGVYENPDYIPQQRPAGGETLAATDYSFTTTTGNAEVFLVNPETGMDTHAEAPYNSDVFLCRMADTAGTGYWDWYASAANNDIRVIPDTGGAGTSGLAVQSFLRGQQIVLKIQNGSAYASVGGEPYSSAVDLSAFSVRTVSFSDGTNISPMGLAEVNDTTPEGGNRSRDRSRLR